MDGNMGLKCMDEAAVEVCHPKNEYVCYNPKEDFCEGCYHKAGAQPLLPRGRKKRAGLTWTGLTSQKLLEGFTGELLWALPGAVRDDADGAWWCHGGGDF